MLNNWSADAKVKNGLALLAFALSLVTYLFTVAPTVSFWDCGEFVASADILGIPHPPGTPFFVLFARVVIIALSFVGEVALRVNLISVFFSAATIYLIFIFAWDLLTKILPAENKSEEGSGALRLAKITGSFTAAFLLAYSDTFWFNAVEAEVYGLAMFLVVLESWLALTWIDVKDTPLGGRLLVFISYLAFLGVGIHLYTLLTIPAVFILFLFADEKFRAGSSWPVWISGVLLYSVVYMVSSFLILTAVVIASSFVAMFVTENPLRARWRLCFWLGVVALIGYSTHAYIPIRSALNPNIDENNPEIADVWKSKDWEAFNAFVERKQYGSEGMLKRAFWRRGQVDNQFMTFPHMGYGGYQFAQYLPWKVGAVNYSKPGSYDIRPEDNSPLVRGGMEFPTQMSFMGENEFFQFLWFAVFNGLLLWICWILWKRNPTLGVYLFLLYAISSVGLIFYINFADGTRPEKAFYDQWVARGMQGPSPTPVHLEVRERDYFFAPAFIFMSLIYGLGTGILVRWLQGNKGLQAGKITGISILALSLVVPAFSNYKEHNRSGLYVPYDYAYNLLESCRPNGILFTNGDNDTFPLWFLQEVEGVRRDVRVVNLSLGNTPWYIKQIKEIEPRLKLRASNAEIDAFTDPYNPESRRRKEFVAYMKKYLEKNRPLLANLEKRLDEQTNPARPNSVSVLSPAEHKKISAKVRKLKMRIQLYSAFTSWAAKDPEATFLKAQERLVLELAELNSERPLHYATTVGSNNMMGLDRYMTMEGMVFTLQRGSLEPPERINLERTKMLIDSVYRFRGLGDGTTYINQETQRLLYNYNHIYLSLGIDARQKVFSAKRTLEMFQGKGDKNLLPPPGLDTSAFAALAREKMSDAVASAERYMELGVKQFPENFQNYALLSDVYQMAGLENKAREILIRGISAVSERNALDLKKRLELLSKSGSR